MQDLPFRYLQNRIRFNETSSAWDITFMTYDYSGPHAQNGQLGFSHCRTVRTTLSSYVTAMAANNRVGDSLREDFLRQVRVKAGPAPDLIP